MKRNFHGNVQRLAPTGVFSATKTHSLVRPSIGRHAALFLVPHKAPRSLVNSFFFLSLSLCVPAKLSFRSVRSLSD